MKTLFRASLWALCFAIAAVGLGSSAVGLGSSAVGLGSSAATQVPSSDTGDWVLPRTPDGHPDLQGNWTNVTLTPFSRPEGQGAILTAEEVAAIEQGRVEVVVATSQASDPDRAPPPAGGASAGSGVPHRSRRRGPALPGRQSVIRSCRARAVPRPAGKVLLQANP